MYDERLMGSVVAQIFKECMHGVKTLATILSDEAKNRDIWGIAGQRYEESIARRHNSMKILGMTRPVPLDRIYTKVNLLEKISASQMLPDAELREFSSIRAIRAGVVRDTKPGLEAVDENDKIMILGKPGSGKTTFLKHLALQAISGHLSNAYVPIFLSLHEVSTSNLKFRDAIDQEFVVAGLRGPTEFVNNLLAKGKCLILLDGLDEVSDDRRQMIVQELIALSEQFYLNKFVITCRLGIYYQSLEKFADMEVADFGETEIRTFVINWFSEDDDTKRADDCIDVVLRNPAIHELASTPLLLTLLCLAYESGSPLSQLRFELYQQAIEELLRKWDERRRIRRDEAYKYMLPKMKLALLSNVAAVTFEREEYFISRCRLVEVVAAFLEEYTDVNPRMLDDDAQGVIDAIEAHHGLFIRQSQDVYSFSHLTLQEFFTALYIREVVPRQQELVRSYCGSRRWHEVFIAVAHLLGDADDYVEWILTEMTSMGFTGQYTRLLRAHKDVGAPTSKPHAFTARPWEERRSITRDKRRTRVVSAEHLRVDLQGAITATAARKARMIEEHLRSYIERAGMSFIEEGLERYIVGKKDDHRRNPSGGRFIPEDLKVTMVSDMERKIKELHYRRISDIDAYIDSWIQGLHQVSAGLEIELPEKTMKEISVRLRNGIELEIDRVSSEIQKDLSSIEVAEVMIEILSTAVVSTNTKGAAIKTLQMSQRL